MKRSCRPKPSRSRAQSDSTGSAFCRLDFDQIADPQEPLAAVPQTVLEEAPNRCDFTAVDRSVHLGEANQQAPPGSRRNAYAPRSANRRIERRRVRRSHHAEPERGDRREPVPRRRAMRKSPRAADFRRLAAVGESARDSRYWNGTSSAGSRPGSRRRVRTKKMVGVRGFEPPTPASRTQCSTSLSYTPIPARWTAGG